MNLVKRTIFKMSFKVVISTLLVVLFSSIKFSFCEEEGNENVIVRNETGKIVGGQIIEVESVPYIAALIFNGGQICGGSIISNQWILSAAHCRSTSNPTDFKIRTGSSRTTRGGTLSDVSEIIVHPNYDPDTENFDFMLMKLKRPIRLNDRQQAIKLASSTKIIPDGTNVIASGWGDTQNTLEQTEFLRAVVVQTVNQDTCNTAYSDGITLNMLCAGTEAGGQDSCQVSVDFKLFKLLHIFLFS